jgi:hypothetical protein
MTSISATTQERKPVYRYDSWKAVFVWTVIIIGSGAIGGTWGLFAALIAFSVFVSKGNETMDEWTERVGFQIKLWGLIIVAALGIISFLVGLFISPVVTLLAAILAVLIWR